MSDLIAFLEARIAEDEHDADWHPRDDWDADAIAAWAGKGAGNLAVRHIARWSPARVLAECKAKRRVVAQRERMMLRGFTTEAAIHELMILALPYATHPDYRSEWAP